MIGTKLSQLLLGDSELEPILEKDLAASWNEGMCRVELSLLDPRLIEAAVHNRASELLSHLISKVFNSHVWLENAYFKVHTGEMVKAFLRPKLVHIIKDKNMMWIVLAKVNSATYTGWTKLCPTWRDFDNFVKRFAPFHTELRFY